MMRGRCRTALGAAVALGLLALGPVAARADGYFGAISVSPGSGATGWGYDFDSSDDAAEAAMRNCSRYAQDCRLAAVFSNGCGAVAANADVYVGDSSPSKEDAMRAAMVRCLIRGGGCSIVRWVCTTNSRW
ncbi:MAG: DUF4189 domain-containing protein [Hyphomicrobiaceae bacterium]|nr:DUF4189 domain-containing protein [Hyphomicrobiaceae bacterium]